MAGEYRSEVLSQSCANADSNDARAVRRQGANNAKGVIQLNEYLAHFRQKSFACACEGDASAVAMQQSYGDLGL